MDETIKLLREQAVLSAHLPELLDELIDVLKNNSSAVQEPIRKIEETVRSLSANEEKSREFLARMKAASFAEFLATQEQNIQRDVAEKLLRKAADAQLRLKAQSEQLKILLQRGNDYVEFNLNILRRVSASDTYGSSARSDSKRTRRMFEANI